MAREILLIREREKPFKLLRPFVETTHIDALKTCIIDRLREAFKKDPEYTYVEDESGSGGPELDPGRNQTQIVITDVYTYDVKLLPAITVRINNSNTYHVSFNQNGSPLGLNALGDVTAGYSVDPETGELERDANGRPIPLFYEYAGAWDSTITLEVSAEDTLTREELVTRLSILMIHVLRDEFYENGIFIRNANVAGENEEPYANDYIYKQAVVLDVYSEWTHRLPVSDETIECFNVAFNMVDDIDNPTVLHRVCAFLCRHPAVEPVEGYGGEELDLTLEQIELEDNSCLRWRIILGSMVGWTGIKFVLSDLAIELLDRECNLSIDEINRQANLADIEIRARAAARSAISQAEFIRSRAPLLEDC